MSSPAVAAASASGAGFALGASGRLLPLSVPMRFFASAALFQLVAWLSLGLGAAQVPRWAGGVGWPLAALHAATLGVLAMSAIGASLQLMPVATLQPLRWARAPLLVWWLYAPGVALLVAGMAAQRPQWMAVAAVPMIGALVLFGGLLARNLAGARGMPGVRAMGWLALAALLVALGSAAALVLVWAGWVAWSRDGLLMLHVVAAVFGFMGLLALGLANILVPMFALGPVPADRTQLGVAALAALALLATVPVALRAWPPAALLFAVGFAAAAVAWHLQSMASVMHEGLRRELGGSFQLVRTGWVGLVATLLLTAAWALAPARSALAASLMTALVACAVAGWLFSFLFGILQRIVPFLVAMHLAGRRRRAPTPSSLTDERALGVHRAAHLAALVALAAGFVFDHAAWMVAASVLGCIGALAFGWFFVQVGRRAKAASGRPAAHSSRPMP